VKTNDFLNEREIRLFMSDRRFELNGNGLSFSSACAIRPTLIALQISRASKTSGILAPIMVLTCNEVGSAIVLILPIVLKSSLHERRSRKFLFFTRKMRKTRHTATITSDCRSDLLRKSAAKRRNHRDQRAREKACRAAKKEVARAPHSLYPHKKNQQ